MSLFFKPLVYMKNSFMARNLQFDPGDFLSTATALRSPQRLIITRPTAAQFGRIFL
jgi:hypothetical protein